MKMEKNELCNNSGCIPHHTVIQSFQQIIQLTRKKFQMNQSNSGRRFALYLALSFKNTFKINTYRIPSVGKVAEELRGSFSVCRDDKPDLHRRGSLMEQIPINNS